MLSLRTEVRTQSVPPLGAGLGSTGVGPQRLAEAPALQAWRRSPPERLQSERTGIPLKLGIERQSLCISAVVTGSKDLCFAWAAVAVGSQQAPSW